MCAQEKKQQRIRWQQQLKGNPAAHTLADLADGPRKHAAHIVGLSVQVFFSRFQRFLLLFFFIFCHTILIFRVLLAVAIVTRTIELFLYVKSARGGLPISAAPPHYHRRHHRHTHVHHRHVAGRKRKKKCFRKKFVSKVVRRDCEQLFFCYFWDIFFCFLLWFFYVVTNF